MILCYCLVKKFVYRRNSLKDLVCLRFWGLCVECWYKIIDFREFGDCFWHLKPVFWTYCVIIDFVYHFLLVVYLCFFYLFRYFISLFSKFWPVIICIPWFCNFYRRARVRISFLMLELKHGTLHKRIVTSLFGIVCLAVFKIES
jgi:hypothetical protein